MTHDLHRDIKDWFAAVEGPGISRVGSAADPAVTPDGARLALTTFTRHSLDQPISSAVAVLDLATSVLEPVVAGAHDRLPRWSPDGRALAWLTDQGSSTDQGSPDRVRPAWSEVGGTVAIGELAGTAEDVAWSPDGRRLLVLVRAADAPGPTSIGVARAGAPAGDWHPTVLRPAEPGGRRSIVVVDTATGEVLPLGDPAVNVWEAVWCGPAAVAAVVSDGPGEETWYSPRLVLLDSEAPGTARPLYAPTTQLGRPAATGSGRRVAVVEAFCSDRSLVAGTVVVAEVGGSARSLDTAGVDVSCCAWLGEELLAFIGVRGLQTVAGEVDVTTGAVRETWVSDGSTSGAYPQAAWGPDGSLTVVAESYGRPPHVLKVSSTVVSGVPGGTERTVLDLAHDGTAELLRRAGAIESVSWAAPDGLRVEGLLVRPSTPGPHPVVLDIHGGPVWAWRNQFRMGQYTTPLLASLGYAVLFPNPRGSSGRGGAYARLVERDVCGPDTGDFLSGLDHLVTAGIADPTRIAVTGTSYGGTMSCWLPTQDPRFAAAVPVAGGTDWVSFHFTTDIPDFDELVLPGDALDPGGEYVRRSPLTHAGQVSTPILHLAGLLDTCVPVSQAMEFHRALSLRGAVSELVVYPGEGHGVHDFPAVADAVTRTVSWIATYAPPDQR